MLLVSWPNLPWLTLVGAIAAFVAVRLDRRLIAPLFIIPYAFPTLVRVLHGTEYALFNVLWMGALLGAILPDALRTPWHLPKLWRAALVYTAFAIIISLLIGTWREIDGSWSMLLGEQVYWQGAEQPSFALRWMLDVSIIVFVGILWFDWLHGAAHFNFEQSVITPLVFGAIANAGVATYQFFIDILFLNEHVFAVTRRASGTMFDGNAAGMVAALWLSGTILWAWRRRGWSLYVLPLGVALNAIAVWATGSRTALLTAIFGVGGGVMTLAARLIRAPVLRLASVAVVGIAAVVLLLTMAAANPSATNAGARAITLVRLLSVSPAAFFNTMWRRQGYGTAATIMIEQSPIAGVGIGSYHGLVPAIGTRIGANLPPDNAQNWLRHQIAELGFVGSSGWIIWFVSFAAFVLIPRRDEDPGAWVVRGALAGFGLASAIGVAGQDAMVALTFWTMAFWYVSLVRQPRAAEPLHWSVWLVMAGLLLVFTAQSAIVSTTSLRVPERTRLGASPFAYGYGLAEPAGELQGFRRMLPKGAALLETQAPFLSITVRRREMPPDHAPIEVRVWKEGQAILKAQLVDTAPVTAFVPIETGTGFVLIESTVRPVGVPRFWPVAKVSDVFMKWEFVAQPPPQYHRYGDGSPEGR